MNFTCVALLLLLGISLVSCGVILRDRAEIEKIAEDLVVEIIEDVSVL